MFDSLRNLFSRKHQEFGSDSDFSTDTPEDDFDITWQQDEHGELHPSWEMSDENNEN